MPNIWITNNEMSIDDMGNNVEIIYPTLYGMGWKQAPIISICAWMEYLSDINPEHESGARRGLLMWVTSQMGGRLNGDEQLTYFNQTVSQYWDDHGHGNANSALWATLDDFKNFSNPELGTIVFGAGYFGYPMDDMFQRDELMINAQYWQVFIGELPKPDDPDIPDDPVTVKKKKMWKFLKPRWR